MDFIRFVRKNSTTRTPDPAFVVIGKAGVIGFSEQCCIDFNIRDFQYGILYYDPKGKRIGIELTNDENEDGIRRVTRRSGRHSAGARISSLAFLQYYGHMPKHSTRYTPVKEGNMLVISLEQEE